MHFTEGGERTITKAPLAVSTAFIELLFLHFFFSETTTYSVVKAQRPQGNRFAKRSTSHGRQYIRREARDLQRPYRGGSSAGSERVVSIQRSFMFPQKFIMAATFASFPTGSLF